MVLRIAVVLCSALAVAHATEISKQDDRKWSEQTNLSVTTIRQIRAAADITESSDSFIKEMNVHALAKRKQILLIEQFSGSGQCLAIHVVQNNSSQFRQVWELGREPLGGGICTVLARSPTVRVGILNEIILNVPSKYIDQPRRVEEYSYTWNGRTYVLKQQRSVDQ